MSGAAILFKQIISPGISPIISPTISPGISPHISSGLPISGAIRAPWLAVHIEHRFRHERAEFHLRLDFTLDAARTVIFGPSGSGKSSLLRAIAGLLKPDEGSIQLHGNMVCQTASGGQPQVFIAPEKRCVGLVMQNPAVFPHLTAAGNVAFALRDLEKSAQKETVHRLLQLVDAENLAGYWPRELSGGQLQRIAIARTLAADPSILLLDEPFAALDARNRQRISQNLHQWARERHVPVLTVTHNLEEAFAAGDEVLTMEEGRILAQGTPEKVLARERERLLQTLHATSSLLAQDSLSAG